MRHPREQVPGPGEVEGTWVAAWLADVPGLGIPAATPVTITPIGEAFALSGTVLRIHVGGDAPLRFVLKLEEAQRTARAAAALRRLAGVDQVPQLVDVMIDEHSGRGALLMEEIGVAVQGDVLAGCPADRGTAVMRALASCHAAAGPVTDVRDEGALSRWQPRVIGSTEWAAVVQDAADAYPRLFTQSVRARAEGLRRRSVDAEPLALGSGEATLIHGDVHLDNVVWRADGSAVLLDWSNAAIGPASVDLVRFLVEGPHEALPGSAMTSELLGAYSDTLARRGVAPRVRAADVAGMDAAMADLSVRIIAWAARPAPAPGSRLAQLRDHAITRVVEWITEH